MSRFVLLFAAGILLAGLTAAPARSQEPPPPHGDDNKSDASKPWDGGPARGPRPPRADRGDGDLPPPGPDQRRPPRDDPPPEGLGENGRVPEPESPGGPEGGRPQPPGPMGRRMDMQSLKTNDPELYKAMQEDRDLEEQTRDQADQYRHAGKAEQAKIKEKLTDIVTRHFAVRQQLRTIEVKRLEQQVKQLQQKIDQREKDRKEIVTKRVGELTRADDDEHF